MGNYVTMYIITGIASVNDTKKEGKYLKDEFYTPKEYNSTSEYKYIPPEP